MSASTRVEVLEVSDRIFWMPPHHSIASFPFEFSVKSNPVGTIRLVLFR
jgi:hypothetical protein